MAQRQRAGWARQEQTLTSAADLTSSAARLDWKSGLARFTALLCRSPAAALTRAALPAPCAVEIALSIHSAAPAPPPGTAALPPPPCPAATRRSPTMAPLWPASTYAQFRPGYPPHVLERIYEFAALPQRELALDVACGTGQASTGRRGESAWVARRKALLPAGCSVQQAETVNHGPCIASCNASLERCHLFAPKQVAVSLAESFQHVVAQDSSASQIAAAQQRPNIRYEQAPAEASGLPDGSVDLITAAQCMHWCGSGGRAVPGGAPAERTGG